MKTPLLSVLILVLEKRNWKPLIDHLEKQQSLLKDPSAVEILIEKDKGHVTSGIKRQNLVNRSQGKYLCFLDDDDWTDDLYLFHLLKGCKSGVDVVTFILDKIPQHKLSRVHHRYPGREKWKFGLYPDHRSEGLMSANHLCAWKRNLATKVGWSPYLGYGDDQLWYKPLMASGIVETQYHIDRPLYHYKLNLNQSANQSRDKIRYSKEYFGLGLSCFWFENQIVVESGTRRHKNAKMAVIDSKGREIYVPTEELKEFAKVRL